MKIVKNIFKLFLLSITVVLASGCSGGDEQVEEVPFRLLQAPDKIVKTLMSDFQFNNLENTVDFFSEDIPIDTVNEICQAFADQRRIGRFEADIHSPHPLPEDAEEAVVQLVYNYTDPKAGFADAEKKVEKTLVKMIKEDGLWKIRSLGISTFDKVIEEGIFLNCLNAVMDTSIAMEKVRINKDSYSSSIAELLNAYPAIDEGACDVLEIFEPDIESYSLHAVTINAEPCNIIFKADADADPDEGTDSYAPKSYEECKENTVTLK